MGRIVEPLRTMGAFIDGRSGGKLAPLAIRGAGRNAKPLSFQSPLPAPGEISDHAVRIVRRRRDDDHRAAQVTGPYGEMLRFFGPR